MDNTTINVTLKAEPICFITNELKKYNVYLEIKEEIKGLKRLFYRPIKLKLGLLSRLEINQLLGQYDDIDNLAIEMIGSILHELQTNQQIDNEFLSTEKTAKITINKDILNILGG